MDPDRWIQIKHMPAPRPRRMTIEERARALFAKAQRRGVPAKLPGQSKARSRIGGTRPHVRLSPKAIRAVPCDPDGRASWVRLNRAARQAELRRSGR